MNVLVLDLALTTGYAARVNGVVHSGIALFDVARDESKGLRTMKLARFLDEVLANTPGGFGLILFEQAHHRGGASTAVAERFIGKLLEWCAVNGNIPHKPVHTATLKKWATGRGNAGKLAMIERAVQLSDDFAARYGAWAKQRKATAAQVEAAWSDEADALCLLHYGFDMLHAGELASKGEKA